MMNVLYYYIYLFNVKFLPYTFPDLNTVWILGSLFALIVNSSLNMGLAYFFGYTLGRFQILSIIILLVIFFHFKYGWCYKKYDTDLDISIIDVKES